MPIPRTNDLPKWHHIPLCYPATLCTPARIDANTPERAILEIGPGRGDFLFHLAETNPTATIIGVELKSKRYFKLIDRIQKRGLTNVRVIQADARHTVASFFEPESINEIHINFPDPWPKKRHTKNRLMSKEFLENCARILKKGGFISFITDAKDYADEVLYTSSEACPEPCRRVEKHKLALFSTSSNNNVFPTYFAQKWQNEGRKFYWMKWKKV